MSPFIEKKELSYASFYWSSSARVQLKTEIQNINNYGI